MIGRCSTLLIVSAALGPLLTTAAEPATVAILPPRVIGGAEVRRHAEVLCDLLAAREESLLLVGLKQHRTARAYYRRLTDLADPAAVLAGLDCRYVLEIDRRNWSDALPLGRRIVEEFALSKPYRDRIVRQNNKLAGLVTKGGP